MHVRSFNLSKKNDLVTELANKLFVFLNLSRTFTYGHWLGMSTYFADLAFLGPLSDQVKDRREDVADLQGVFCIMNRSSDPHVWKHVFAESLSRPSPRSHRVAVELGKRQEEGVDRRGDRRGELGFGHRRLAVPL